MPDYLKTLHTSLLERFIKDKVDTDLGREFSYEIKNLNTPNVNTTGDNISFRVEIRNNKQ